MSRVLVALLALASCGRQNETCSALTPCLAGGYQFCKSGASCRYHLTDGTTVNCASCSDCVEAVNLVEKLCDPANRPPDLGSSIPTPSIPKSAVYTGPRMDPLLDSAASCPDHDLEPNDASAPIEIAAPADQPTPKLVKLAICPRGSGDSDWFQLTLPNHAWLTAEIFYDVAFGDLDVAIADSGGRLLASDGSAASNGCTATSLTAGVYYLVVTGANNVEVNRYDLAVRSYSTPHTCP